MKDRRHTVGGAVERGGIADVADDPFDVQPGEVVVGAARLAQRPNRIARPQEGAHHRGTDEARCAGDQDRTGFTPVRVI